MELTALAEPDLALMPAPLRIGDKVRFVSPASPPPREWVSHCAKMLESWGLEVDFGEHVFGKVAWLAGTDEERLADFNAALRDHIERRATRDVAARRVKLLASMASVIACAVVRRA